MGFPRRRQNQMIPNRFPGLSDQRRKNVETVWAFTLLQFLAGQRRKSAHQIHIADQLIRC